MIVASKGHHLHVGFCIPRLSDNYPINLPQSCCTVQAGTYVKEFCHGDESRTKPSLTSLLACNDPIQVLELDVTEIHLDFP